MIHSTGSELPEFKKFGKIPRLSRDCIITEKLDGTNGQILITEDKQIFAGSRSRWLTPGISFIDRKGVARKVNDSDNYGFAEWVYDNQEELIQELGPGRHFGEWWGRGINRGYGLEERQFSLFNVQLWYDIPRRLCGVVPILFQGEFTTENIWGTMNDLLSAGSAAVPGWMAPEGIVILHDCGALFKKTFENDGFKGEPAQ